MELINISAITILHKQPFIQWHNALRFYITINENILGEAKTYLVKDNFEDSDKIIKKTLQTNF
jgi:hypothetical protein